MTTGRWVYFFSFILKLAFLGYPVCIFDPNGQMMPNLRVHSWFLHGLGFESPED